MKDINFFKDVDTSFIIISSVRYCHGRRTYAPGLVTDWIKKYWEHIDQKTKDRLLKDTEEYIKSDLSKGDICDKLTWEHFYNWLLNNV